MRDVINKNKEVIMYIIFGVLTTIVNILVYSISTRLLNLDVYTSNVIAWIAAVLFAYITNRRYVFESNVKTVKDAIKEFVSFYLCRLVTFGFDMLFMYIMIDMMIINDMVSKVVVSFIVIALNYVFSKLIIFKK